jgi:hypothetical protein
VLENTVACELMHDFLVFVHLTVFGDHGETEVTPVEVGRFHPFIGHKDP